MQTPPRTSLSLQSLNDNQDECNHCRDEDVREEEKREKREEWEGEEEATRGATREAVLSKTNLVLLDKKIVKQLLRYFTRQRKQHIPRKRNRKRLTQRRLPFLDSLSMIFGYLTRRISFVWGLCFQHFLYLAFTLGAHFCVSLHSLPSFSGLNLSLSSPFTSLFFGCPPGSSSCSSLFFFACCCCCSILHALFKCLISLSPLSVPLLPLSLCFWYLLLWQYLL